jgi:energy-coupling factor transporter ATP-binding protein EcfA2
MNYPLFFDPKNSLNLYGLNKDFNFLSFLYQKKKLPKVLMLTGRKGIGKSTLVNHLLYSIFDEKKYDKKNFSLSNNSSFHSQFSNNIFPNVIYVNGSDFKSVKIDDVRNLKNKILQSTFSGKDRFIILDDVELFSINSLNALLKTIEEPGKNNFFFLINNKSKPLLDTMKSRSLEIKIILNEITRLEIISKLSNLYELNPISGFEHFNLTPGNYVKFCYICNEQNISLESHFTDNLSLLLDLYKKNRDILFINLALFIAENYLKNLADKNFFKTERIIEMKNFIINNLNNYVLYNINQNSLINAINNKLNYE